VGELTGSPTQVVLGALHPSVSNVGATPTVAAAKPKTTVKKPAAKKAPAKKKPVKKKKPSATQKYLAGDTTYQQQMADYNKSKADYSANYTRQTGIVNRDYAESQRTLNRQGAQDRLDQQNDFAGRGILHSGVFATALGNYNTEFNSRMKGLTTGKTDQLGDLSAQRKSFLQQLQIEMNNAREDALRRRAAKLGI
jgi:hypothetical protein